MGALYSVINYIKPWLVSQNITLNATKINISMTKLILTLKNQQSITQNQCKQLQNTLKNMINGPSNSRSAPGQKILMQTIVRKSQLVAAYEQIIRCANIIKNQSNLLQLDFLKISNDCSIAICTILYANKNLQLSNYINLKDFVPQSPPQIDKNLISPQLREYIDYHGPTFEAINVYVLEMCVRNNITLDRVNEVGHQFVYNPMKNMMRESKSFAMFALSIESQSIDTYCVDDNGNFKMGYEENQQNNGEKQKICQNSSNLDNNQRRQQAQLPA